MPDLITLGCAALDVVALVDRLPISDEKYQATAVILEAGGPAATAAATSSRLGISTQLVAVIGDDDIGEMIVSFNQRDGVKTDNLQRQAGCPSPISMILVEPKGLRSIVWSRGELRPLTQNEALLTELEECDLLLVDGHELVTSIQVAKLRKSRGLFTIMDAGTLRPGMEELASHCQLIATSRKFATQLMGEFSPVDTVQLLRSKGAVSAMVTGGEDGAWGISDDGCVYHQPGFPVEAVDTTGAGDIFHGAWAASWLKGIPWLEQMRWAAGAAALGCRFAGGRKGIPDERELLAFLEGYNHIQPQKMV